MPRNELEYVENNEKMTEVSFCDNNFTSQGQLKRDRGTAKAELRIWLMLETEFFLVMKVCTLEEEPLGYFVWRYAQDLLVGALFQSQRLYLLELMQSI